MNDICYIVTKVSSSLVVELGTETVLVALIWCTCIWSYGCRGDVHCGICPLGGHTWRCLLSIWYILIFTTQWIICQVLQRMQSPTQFISCFLLLHKLPSHYSTNALGSLWSKSLLDVSGDRGSQLRFPSLDRVVSSTFYIINLSRSSVKAKDRPLHVDVSCTYLVWVVQQALHQSCNNIFCRCRILKCIYQYCISSTNRL